MFRLLISGYWLEGFKSQIHFYINKKKNVPINMNCAFNHSAMMVWFEGTSFTHTTRMFTPMLASIRPQAVCALFQMLSTARGIHMLFIKQVQQTGSTVSLSSEAHLACNQRSALFSFMHIHLGQDLAKDGREVWNWGLLMFGSYILWRDKKEKSANAPGVYLFYKEKGHSGQKRTQLTCVFVGI